MSGKTMTGALAIAVAASACTLLVQRALGPSLLEAQQERRPLDDYVIHAAPRGDGGTAESFIFVNRPTGDIWVYENENVKEHYRVVAVGEKLVEVKR